MEPFTLHCTTCRARLKVKDESVVGSILNCPRCGSMVHVVPPVDWKSPDSAAAGAAGSSKSATESSITLSLPLSSAVEAASAPLPPAPPTLPKADAASTLPAVVPPVSEPPATATNEVATAEEAVIEQAGANWLSWAATWLRGDGLIWVGGLSAGVVVGAATWFVMTGLTSTPPASPEVAKPAQVAQTEAPDKPSDVKQAPAVESAPVVAAPASSSEAAPAEPSPAEQAPVVADASQVAAESSPTEPPIAKSPEAPASPSAAETSAPVAAREPSLKLDPAAAPAADSAANDAVDSILGTDSASEPSAADAADADANVDKPAGRANADEPVAMTQEDVDAALAVKLDQVKFVAVPLAQFVEFIADTSALQISVDDAALAKVGKKRTMPLSVHLSDTTAQEALHAAISPLGLVCELRGNRLFVTVPGK